MAESLNEKLNAESVKFVIKSADSNQQQQQQQRQEQQQQLPNDNDDNKLTSKAAVMQVFYMF